eukprot:Opistho-2@59332
MATAARYLMAALFVSEGRNATVIRDLANAAHSQHGAALVYSHVDSMYHRSSFHIAGRPQSVVDAAFAVSKEAFARIDLTKHSGSHPRVGVVDLIALYPLDCRLDAASDSSRALGRRIGEQLATPVLLYGAAHGTGRSLVDVRRQTSFYRSTGAVTPSVSTSLAPDFGPIEVPPSRGITVCGATPYVWSCNVQLDTSDLDLGAVIAKKARSETLQTMALLHDNGKVEIACNVLASPTVDAAKIESAVGAIASQHSVRVTGSYPLGIPPEAALAAAREELSKREQV